MDIELSCHIFSCYRVVCFNIFNVNSQVFAVIFICNTYRLDIVSFSEFSCIQPYLVVYFITFLECLSIDILSFVVISLISVRICVSVCNLIFQFAIVIEKFNSCKIEFRFVKDVFLWVKVWSIWRSYFVVELFISSICHVSDKCFSCSIMFNFNCNNSFHTVVLNCAVSTFNFFYSVLVSTFLAFLVLNSFELNVT